MSTHAKSLNQTVIKTAELLSDCEYHDGISIGDNLNITRAAVWKIIKKLQQYGIPVTSVKGKGYRLKSPLVLLDYNKIKLHLRHHLDKCDIFEKTDSTNEDLKEFSNQNKKIRVCLAETQLQGKGRFNREWYSPFGKNIYFSMLYPFAKDISELSGLSLVVGLAVCSAIESVIGSDISMENRFSGLAQMKVKWPNDIYADQSKLAGILIETEAEANGFCQVIMGIGINVNMPDAPKKSISKSWTSLLKITQQYQDRNILCAALINFLIDYLKLFSSEGLLAFLDEWKKRDYLFNKAITIVSGEKKLRGICVGINKQGFLQLKTSDGSIKTSASGDTILQK